MRKQATNTATRVFALAESLDSSFFLSFPRSVILIAGPEQAQGPAGKGLLRLIQNPFSGAESAGNLACSSSQND
jgi:hypothetical protein